MTASTLRWVTASRAELDSLQTDCGILLA